MLQIHRIQSKSRSALRASVLTAFATGSSILAAPETPVDFAREVLPVLSNKCFACHGPDTKKENELRLDSYAAATTDHEGRRAINPDALEESEILKRIHDKEDPMPPVDAEKQLTETERNLITRWVRGGGEYARHWAFVPPMKHATDKKNIDDFILAKLNANKVGFQPEADPVTLARRVALVLTGLPPEPGDLEAFLADENPGAYERFVDSLLDSPRFGEHQARYWLDAVRYGDTHGLHLDNRRGIYPYRDWVVRAFNKNLPLDDFITWQLAGDLLPEPSLEQLVATGFVRMNPTTSEGGVIPAEFQAKNNFDRTETFGTVLLGVSMTCARCHTHKYDPITQTEYYQLLAFFNSTAERSLDGNSYTYEPVAKVPADLSGWKDWEKLEAERSKLFREASASTLLSSKWNKADTDDKVAMLLDSSLPDKLRNRARDLAKRIEKARETFTTTLVAKDLEKPRPTHVLQRGEYHLPFGDPLEPGVLSAMGALPEGAPRNRLGLARWLTSDDHPLVTRVLINRIWQRTFGYGIVRTPEDFGLQGEQPTHPELLDWLAVELRENGWNLKHMLRLMVTSKTFRQQSTVRTDIADPENRLFSRGPGYRLDAEVLRDLGLWASGLLDPHMGGEGVKPYQPDGMWSALAHPASNTKKYKRDKGQRLYRRSLYVYWKRTSPHPMMTLFDAPNRETSCVRRSRSNTSLQSLGLLNETQRVEMARKFAERLLKERKDDDARLDRAYKLLSCRPPTDKERSTCLTLLESMRKRYAAAKEDALALLAAGDAPRDESINPTELAAWTQLATTILASDATILLY